MCLLPCRPTDGAVHDCNTETQFCGLYGYETWSVTLTMFENGMLRQIFVFVGGGVFTGDWNVNNEVYRGLKCEQ